MEFVAVSVTPSTSGPPTDWAAWKLEVLGKLNIAEEFESLGVEFTRSQANSKGIRECRAVGRSDEEPSAFVNVKTGVYHDSGGDGSTMDLFKFALIHGGGRWGKWIEVAKHYAERSGVPLGSVSYGAKGRILEAIYRYQDPAGRLVFGVHRYRLPNGDKTFRQFPWKDGDWFKAIDCMMGIPLYPYRLPQLIESASDEPIWILEGEKDCDRAASLGLLATTNPMGAGKWLPEFSDYLTGRTCFIVPDMDPAGRNHAIKVAGMIRPLVKSVKVVDLPGLGYHGDLSDWLDAGGSAEELGRLAYASPEWSPESTEEVKEVDLSRDATVADLRQLQSTESWVWPLWIPSAALTLLAAEGGTGKTRFSFDLARRIYHGLDWPDGTKITLPPGAKTLWVVADNQWQEMCDIPAAFGIPDECVVVNASAADPYGGTSLETAEELADFEARIRRVKPALVIIDTITNTSDLKSQDTSDAKKQYKPLQEIATRCGVAIVCVTHLNSNGKVLGRRATEKVRVVIQLSCPDPEGQPHRRRLWVEKSKAIKPPPLGVSMGDEGNEYDTSPPDVPDASDNKREGAGERGPVPEKAREAAAWLEKRLGIGSAKVGLIRRESEEAGISTPRLYKAKEMLGVIEEIIDERKWWRLPQDAGECDDFGNCPAF